MLYLSWINNNLNNVLYQPSSPLVASQILKYSYKNLLKPRKQFKTLFKHRKLLTINPNLHFYTILFDLTTLRTNKHLFLGTRNSYSKHSIFKIPNLVKDSIFRKLRFLKKRIRHFNKHRFIERTNLRKNKIFLKKITSSYLILLNKKNTRLIIRKQPMYFLKKQLRSQKIWKRVKKHSSYTPFWRPNVDQKFHTRRPLNHFTYKSSKPRRAKNFKWRTFNRTKNFTRFNRFVLTRSNVSPIRTPFNTLAQKSYKIRIRVRQKPTSKLKFYYTKKQPIFKTNKLKRKSILSITFRKQNKPQKTILPFWRKRKQKKKLRRFQLKKHATTFKYHYKQKRRFIIRRWKRLKRILKRRSKRFIRVNRRNNRVRIKNFKIDTRNVYVKKRKYTWKLKKIIRKKKVFKRFYKFFFSNIFHKRLRYKRAFRYIRWKWTKTNRKRFLKRRLRKFLKRRFFKKRLKRRNRFKRLRARFKRRYVLNTKFQNSLIFSSAPYNLNFHKLQKVYNTNGTKFLSKKHFYKTLQNKFIAKIKILNKLLKFTDIGLKNLY